MSDHSRMAKAASSSSAWALPPTVLRRPGSATSASCWRWGRGCDLILRLRRGSGRRERRHRLRRRNRFRHDDSLRDQHRFRHHNCLREIAGLRHRHQRLDRHHLRDDDRLRHRHNHFNRDDLRENQRLGYEHRLFDPDDLRDDDRLRHRHNHFNRDDLRENQRLGHEHGLFDPDDLRDDDRLRHRHDLLDRHNLGHNHRRGDQHGRRYRRERGFTAVVAVGLVVRLSVRCRFVPRRLGIGGACRERLFAGGRDSLLLGSRVWLTGSNGRQGSQDNGCNQQYCTHSRNHHLNSVIPVRTPSDLSRPATVILILGKRKGVPGRPFDLQNTPLPTYRFIGTWQCATPKVVWPE